MKWGQFPRDVLPAAIAEMDFPPATPIRDAVEALVSTGDYGYPIRLGGAAEEAVSQAFARRMAARFCWQIEAAHVQAVTDLVQATAAAIVAFTEPGDGVLVQTPCYPPFREAIEQSGRHIVENRMIDCGTKFGFDIEELEAAADRSSLFIVCNPHNPTGRVFTRSELENIARVAIERDLIILSDEVHSDLVYDGASHIPIATLGADIAARTITINSASKSFNIPGLRCGGMHFGSDELRRQFRLRVPRSLLGRPSAVGIDASVAAWDSCQPWLDQVMAHLTAMRNLVVDTIRAEMPSLKVHVPEATFLAWIDCAALNWAEPAGQRFLERGRIAFSPGETFCPDHRNFVRLNFAGSSTTITEMLDLMTKTVRAR